MSLPTSPKLEQLQKMLAKEPNDPFLLYGLGMEYKKLGALEEAIRFFRETITTDANYCYAYYQAAQTSEIAENLTDAKEYYRAGIAAAARSGDSHAASELQGALALIE